MALDVARTSWLLAGTASFPLACGIASAASVAVDAGAVRTYGQPGDVPAQSFYGHILLFRGQGLGAREEGLRLLRLAANGGDGKAAYQLGVQALQADTRQAADAMQAVRWWEMALAAGHPLAARRLSQLYREGAPGLEADAQAAERYAGMADSGR